jgi:hypothetical protein
MAPHVDQQEVTQCLNRATVATHKRGPAPPPAVLAVIWRATWSRALYRLSGAEWRTSQPCEAPSEGT